MYYQNKFPSIIKSGICSCKQYGFNGKKLSKKSKLKGNSRSLVERDDALVHTLVNPLVNPFANPILNPLVNPFVNPILNPLESNMDRVHMKETNTNCTEGVERSKHRDSKNTDIKNKKTNTELKIYSCNVRSINNKRKSVEEMLYTVQPDVAFFF